MADTAGGAPEAPEESHHSPHKETFWALALGSMGVVFGDIGTSPLYAMREALRHTRSTVSPELAVLGVVSLVTWALILIVTVKYVIFLMRADNKGEGGTLALMALAQRFVPRRSGWVLLLGMVGAALFYGDGIITPAMTVLAAVEGVRDAPGAPHQVANLTVPISAGILIALFLVQAKGTASVARFFGPICAVWFLVLAALGVYHIAEDVTIFRALSPHYGVIFLWDNGFLGFVILGSVFLAVTGAEALYADMGHFGRNPIRAAWLAFVLPALLLNYLGQGAMVIHHPATRANPFFEMIPASEKCVQNISSCNRVNHLGSKGLRRIEGVENLIEHHGPMLPVGCASSGASHGSSSVPNGDQGVRNTISERLCGVKLSDADIWI